MIKEAELKYALSWHQLNRRIEKSFRDELVKLNMAILKEIDNVSN